MGTPPPISNRRRQPPPSPKSPLELPPPIPPPLAAAVSKITVAQICQSVGFHGAQPSALRSLSDVAARYLQALARSAASAANSRGRTDANLSDLVLAIEDLSSPRGFQGAADPGGPLLRSGALRELMCFVASVEEVPFARPIRREASRMWPLPPRPPSRASPPSFAQLGREPPSSHVPRWLPVFPDSWDSRRREGEKEEVGKEDGVPKRGGEDPRGRPSDERWRYEEQKEEEEEEERGVLPVERARVRFKLGLGLGLGRRVGGEGRGKKKRGIIVSKRVPGWVGEN